jgi:DNA-directed RNA polymerase subunit RPC12/RpoP
MGEAKKRGTPEERAEQAKTRLDSLRPSQLVCGECRTAFTEFEAIFGGSCPNCGNDVLVFKGEPEAVADAMIAWERMMGADAKLGYQSADGSLVPFDEESQRNDKRGTRH